MAEQRPKIGDQLTDLWEWHNAMGGTHQEMTKQKTNTSSPLPIFQKEGQLRFSRRLQEEEDKKEKTLGRWRRNQQRRKVHNRRRKKLRKSISETPMSTNCPLTVH